MTQNAADILIGGARVFYAPVGEAAPADDTAYGAAWGGNWVEVGFTASPLVWAHSFEERDARVQQRLGPVKRARTSEDVVLETTLAQITSDNLQLALGGSVTTTPAGAVQVGKDELETGGEALLDERAWGFEGLYVDDSGDEFPVRLFVWKATSTINGNLEFAKETEAGIPLQVKALVDTGKVVGKDLVKFQRVTEAATG
jgi:hypothetical protein